MTQTLLAEKTVLYFILFYFIYWSLMPTCGRPWPTPLRDLPVVEAVLWREIYSSCWSSQRSKTAVYTHMRQCTRPPLKENQEQMTLPCPYTPRIVLHGYHCFLHVLCTPCNLHYVHWRLRFVSGTTLPLSESLQCRQGSTEAREEAGEGSTGI